MPFKYCTTLHTKSYIEVNRQNLLRVLSPHVTEFHFLYYFFWKSIYFYTCTLHIKSFLWLKIDIKNRYMWCLHEHLHALVYLGFLYIIPPQVLNSFVTWCLTLTFLSIVFLNFSRVFFKFKLYVYIFSGESKERSGLVKKRMVYKGCFVTFTK